jgi:hypothetical protein
VRKSLFLSSLLILVSPSTPVSASTTSGGWYVGNWNCTLDGRPTRMNWKVVSVDYGGEGTSEAGAEMRGQFWDRDGPWVSLKRLSAGADWLRFKHADGNTWYLRKTSNKEAKGHSTWNGQKYPFNCVKA